MQKYDANEIFTPGGMPALTYNPRHDLKLEAKLIKKRKNTNKFISVTGNTKSGKTVLVQKLFPRDETIWFDCGSFETEENFWVEVCEQLDLYTTKSKGSSNEEQIGGLVETEGSIPFFAKIKAALSTLISRTDSTNASRTIPSRNAAMAGLRKTNIPIILDDFHYIMRESQKSILRTLKPLVFIGHPIILISIPHRKYDMLKAERELTGRIEEINVPSWEKSELVEIANKGFPLLNVEINKKLFDKVTHEAIGSPHLMQELCLGICESENITETLDKNRSLNTIDDEILYSVAESTGRAVFEKLKKGPRTRSDRQKRLLKNGVETDIYGVILAALENIKPDLQTLEYENIRTAIRNVIESKMPQVNEVTRVLDYMAKISFDENSSTPVIDWDKEEQQLHITDPFFAFYLRWGKMKISI